MLSGQGFRDVLLYAAACFFFSAPSVLGVAPIWEQGAVKPSANAGKTGTYHCETSQKGYNFFVYVPKTYSEANPAGLHLFFHGQGSQGSARSFDNWAQHFLEKYNLIGINMEYTDGDNSKDTAGKVRAAEEAVAQVMADYRIVKGRGVVASFSGGGLVHGNLFLAYAGKNRPRAEWPFNHMCLYSSNFWDCTLGAMPMSWYIGVGTEEWNMGQPSLGATQPRRAGELYSDAAKGGCPDVHFKVVKGKGHTIVEEEVVAAAECFGRSDVALAPFLRQADYEERELAPVVLLSNAASYAKADALLAKVLSDKKASQALKDKAAVLKKLIEARIDRMAALTRDLAQKDPVLCNYYGKLFLQQLALHPRQKEVRDILVEAEKDKNYRAALGAFGLFTKHFGSFFSNAALGSAAVPILEQIKQFSGEQALYGRMATEYLALQ